MTYAQKLAQFLTDNAAYKARPFAPDLRDAFIVSRNALLAAHPMAKKYQSLYIWGNYIVGRTTEYGHAARGNRGRYAGTKLHQLGCDYVVDLLEPDAEVGLTVGNEFRRTGRPVLFQAQPWCAVTQGQRAGQPSSRYTAADVTCAKCRKFIGIHNQPEA